MHDMRSIKGHVVSRHLPIEDAPFACLVCQVKYADSPSLDKHVLTDVHRARMAFRPDFAGISIRRQPRTLSTDGMNPDAMPIPMADNNHQQHPLPFSHKKPTRSLLVSCRKPLPTIQLQEADSLPIIQQQEADPLSTGQLQEADPLPTGQPQEVDSLPTGQPQEANPLPTVQPQEADPLPTVQPREAEALTTVQPQAESLAPVQLQAGSLNAVRPLPTADPPSGNCPCRSCNWRDGRSGGYADWGYERDPVALRHVACSPSSGAQEGPRRHPSFSGRHALSFRES